MFRPSKLALCALALLMTFSSNLFAAPGDARKALEAKGIKKIAVIPPANNKNYVFEFLKKEGMDKNYQVLTPKEFVDSAVFNPTAFPIAVFAGSEKYLQTVKDPTDGDRAILNYVAKGGMLLVFSDGPTPFFFNEKNRVVDSANMLGVPIIKGKDDKFGTAAGFEKPADGAKLSYSVQKDLKGVEGGLQDKMPFPATGDLRWRPVANKNASKAYIPLISVVDENNMWLGDAAAYNSGIIYAWFRLTQPEEASRDKYISALFKYAAKGSALPREENKSLAALDKSSALARKFKDARIALLPSAIPTGIEGWMAKNGLGYDKMEWEDVVDPAKFNAKKYPIAVYAGGEKYKQTVKSYADVDDALIRYMSDGGTLILTTYESWPMFMNDENKPTFITAKLGFPICGTDDQGGYASDPKLVGFEKPKPETKVTFVINTNKMKDLPVRLAYPTEGDLRWRPFAGTQLPKGDTYIPLVSLYDSEDNNYGDGVAYIEHKESQPLNGKGVYIWNRGAELLGDQLYFDVFSFLAESK